jgi:hypothetical protein
VSHKRYFSLYVLLYSCHQNIILFLRNSDVEAHISYMKMIHYENSWWSNCNFISFIAISWYLATVQMELASQAFYHGKKIRKEVNNRLYWHYLLFLHYCNFLWPYIMTGVPLSKKHHILSTKCGPLPVDLRYACRVHICK